MPCGKRWNAAKFDILAWVIYVGAIGVEPDKPHNLSMLHLALFWARVPRAAWRGIFLGLIMAGDWIKMRRSLLGDPRAVRMALALRVDRFRIIGGLFSAWCLFDEHAEDGELDGYTPQAFDEIVGMPGICKAMASVGWIEICEDRLCLLFCDKIKVAADAQGGKNV